MTKNKQNLGLKVLSTTAALAMLASSVATPVSVFANEMKENKTVTANGNMTRALIGASGFQINQYSTHAVEYGASASSVLSTLKYDHRATEIATGRFVYPSSVSMSSTVNTSSPGLYVRSVTVNYNDSKLSGSLTYTTNIRVFEDTSNNNGSGNETQEYKVTMNTDKATIEYGTLFNPETEFSGYVTKDNLVYSSVKSYSGNYKNGVKAGTYTGNLNFKNTSYNFNLSAPVTVTVVTTLLDEATKLVNGLFTDNGFVSLKDSVTQADIDASLAKVNALPNTAEKNTLLNHLEKAQALFNKGSNEYKAEEAVNQLFGDDAHTTLADGMTQADIDAATEAVNKVTDEAKKAELLSEIQKAQDLLNTQEAAKEEVQKAEANVNALFGDDAHTNLADDVTQADIDAAKEAVNNLSDESKKEELLNEIQKAQDLLTTQEETNKAEANVNALFGDDAHTNLADGVTQADIDAAKEAVNNLSDESKKAELLNEIQKAQDLLTTQEETSKAEQNVNDLFADDAHTILNDDVTQADIEKAKEDINKLTDEAKKEELLNEIQKAQDLLAANEAEANVNALFGDDAHTNLADGVTQADIDAAKEAVNNLSDGSKKEALLNEIQKAQDLFDKVNHPLTLTTLTAISSEISGSAKPNSQLRISINGAAKTVIKADDQGNYQWRVSKLAINDVVKVEMKNEKTNKFDQSVEQRITDNGVTEETITVNDMQAGDTTIAGKTTPNGQVRISFDGTPKNVVYADANGKYQFVVASGMKTGTEIKVELKSKGSYSVAATTTVLARVLTLNDITAADDVVIAGTTRNPGQKLRISINGKAKTIISAQNGVYEYRMGKVAADTVIKVEAMEGSKVIETVEQTAISVSNTERPDVKLDAISAGVKTTITGQSPANSSLRISINGKTKTIVTADAEGQFTYMLGKVVAGDQVKIEIREGKTFVFATQLTVQ